MIKRKGTNYVWMEILNEACRYIISVMGHRDQALGSGSGGVVAVKLPFQISKCSLVHITMFR